VKPKEQNNKHKCNDYQEKVGRVKVGLGTGAAEWYLLQGKGRFNGNGQKR
jgi:hypothetical protein